MRGGTITPRKLKDGSTSYVLMWRVDGRQFKQTVKGTRRDAEAALTAALASRDRGEQRKPSVETFADFAAAWLEAKRPRLELATCREYEAHLRLRLLPAFGRLRLRDVTRSRVEAWVAREHAAGKVGAKTINNGLVVLALVMGRAVRDGMIGTNPALGSRDDPIRLPYEAPPMNHLVREQAAAYLAAASPTYRALAELLLGTGVRIGEACALELPDLDLEALTLRVSRSRKLGGAVGGTKGDRSRVVHISPRLADVLAAHLRARDPRTVLPLVFVTERGNMLNPANVRNRWHRRTLEAAGLEWIRLHDLRHSAASLAVAAGESILFVQAQLGHANVRTTQRYAHADHQAHRAAAARVADYLAD